MISVLNNTLMTIYKESYTGNPMVINLIREQGSLNLACYKQFYVPCSNTRLDFSDKITTVHSVQRFKMKIKHERWSRHEIWIIYLNNVRNCRRIYRNIVRGSSLLYSWHETTDIPT